eukprot:1253372-Rhodomonas_salina.1
MTLALPFLHCCRPCLLLPHLLLHASGPSCLLLLCCLRAIPQGVYDQAWLKLKLGTSKPELARKGKQKANGTISLSTFARRDSVLSMLYPVLFNPACSIIGAKRKAHQ